MNLLITGWTRKSRHPLENQAYPSGVSESEGPEDEGPEQSPLGPDKLATSEAKLKGVSSSDTTKQPRSSSLFVWTQHYGGNKACYQM